MALRNSESIVAEVTKFEELELCAVVAFRSAKVRLQTRLGK